MFPNTDNGAFWDILPDSNADIAVALARAGSSPALVWDSPNYYTNVLSSGSNFFDFVPASPIVILQPQTTHVIELYDYDGAEVIPSANDSMGAMSFPPYIPANGFPPIVYLSNVGGTLKFELTVTYQF